MKSLIPLAIVSMTMVGCAAKFVIPGNRFMTAENSGQFLKGEIKGAMAAGSQVQVANDMTSSSPDTTPDLYENNTLTADIQLGLFKWLDVYVAGGSSSPTSYGVKIQILGEPRLSAKEGDFSLGFAGGILGGDYNQTANNNDSTGEAKFDFGGWEALALIGYRINEGAIAYLNPFMTYVEADVTLKRTQNSTVTTTATPSGSGDMRGVSVGVRVGTNFFVDAQASFIDVEWKRVTPSPLAADRLQEAVFGAAVGGSW